MPPDAIASLRALQGGQPAQRVIFRVTFTDTKPPKLLLPDVPTHDDTDGLCAWLTCVFRLDPQHPVTGADKAGNRGDTGHVLVHRAGAPTIRFEPAAAIMTARRLQPILCWQLGPTDGEPYGFTDEHCRRIAHVLRLVCSVSEEISEEQQTTNILSTFLSSAAAVEGHTTQGTGAQRYEAAEALKRDPSDRARYLIDANTGELVIRASDLQSAARDATGSSLPRGWLEARMEEYGWKRFTLQGHPLDHHGRRCGHAIAVVYRGFVPQTEDADAD